MKFLIGVFQNHLHCSSNTSLELAKSIVSNPHHALLAVFFAEDGVYTGVSNIELAKDEINLSKQWRQLYLEYDVPLLICKGAAKRRGIDNIIACEFMLSSSIQFAQLFAESDKQIILGK